MVTKKCKCTSCEADYILKYEDEELYQIQCPFCGFENVDEEDEDSEIEDDENKNWD